MRSQHPNRFDIYFRAPQRLLHRPPIRRALMPFVELDGSLVFLCRCPGRKRP
jgi:hypothetical protein